MTTMKWIGAALAAAAVLGIAGCGESTQVVVYKQGKYQGKPDSKPWDNEQFKGSQVEWEKAIKTRTQGQDEYSRAVASAK